MSGEKKYSAASGQEPPPPPPLPFSPYLYCDWLDKSKSKTMYTADQMRERDAMWMERIAAPVDVERCRKPTPILTQHGDIIELWLCMRDKDGLLKPLPGTFPMRVDSAWKAAIDRMRSEKPE